jgi:hypothetical protein
MKRFLFLLVAMAFTVSEYAADYQVSGKMSVTGSQWTNQEQAVKDGTTFSNYDQDLTIDAKMVVDETTYVQTTLGVRDQVQGKKNATTKVDGYTYEATGDEDKQVRAEKAFLHTMVGPLSVDLGLMGAGTWGTAFNDNGTEAYRVKLQYMTPAGLLVALLQKDAEKGAAGKEDSELDDDDTYYLGFVTKAADFNLQFLLANSQKNNYSETLTTVSDFKAGDLNVTSATLAFDGTVGPVNLEGEVTQANYAFGGDLKDVVDAMGVETSWSTMGLYLNGNMAFGEHNAGLALAYGSYDKDAGKGMEFGDDFDMGLILGDDSIKWSGGTTNIAAATAAKLYANIAVNDFTITPAVIMATSNQKDAKYEGAAATELDLIVSYKISDAASYAIKYATLSQTVDEDNYGSEDGPETVSLLCHEVVVKF